MARTGATPSNSSSSTSSPPELFATDITNNFVELKNVILNEFHVLRKFLLISLCDQALRVTLDSDLSSSIGFQLNNENIDNNDESSGTEPVVATFLADDFSELFNTVNLVNEVILQPRQVQQVILTFRPLESSSDASEHERDFKEGQREIELSSDAEIQENGSVEPSSKAVHPRANQSFKVTGMVFLSATVLSDNSRTQVAPISDKSLDCRQDIVIHFQSTVCRSILKADVQDIVFDDCVPGGVFVKDFSVWNLSEVPCSFQLHVKNGQTEQPSLDLTDYDTGLPISSGEIKSCAHRRIRVMYKPREVGDCAYSIQLENSFDVRNSTCIPVQCIVNAEHRREGLLVTGVGEDGVLDFGDCYANNGTCQMLTVRNITQEALVVNLGTDHSPGDKVNFYLQPELDMSAGSTTLYQADANNPEHSPLIPDDESTSSVLTLKLGDCLGTRVNFDKKNRVEELSLGRGEEKNLLVWFYAAGASDEAKAPKLQRRTFRLSLKCVEKKGRSKQRFSNIIQGKARVCTSIVKLSTPELNFGDCNIGSHKSASVDIMNLSDLPALVTSYVTSTVLSFKSNVERVLIPPRQSYRLDIDLVPLKINLNYRKQISIDNFYNKENQQVLEVRAKIMDRHHVLLHSLYYKLHTPSTNNFLNFDCAIVNNPSIRTLAIENITEKSLVLGFSTSLPEELGIYQLRDDCQSELGDDTCSTLSEGSEEETHESRRRAYAALMNKEKLLETLEESQPRLKKAIVDSAPFPVQQGHNKSIPPRPPFTPFTGSKRKARMRMSLDLATSSSFPSNGGDKSLLLVSSGSGSVSGNGESKVESLDAVKPFGHPGDDIGPRPLKRVQSSAVLSAIEEVQNIVSESSQEEVSPEGIEEVLKRLSDHVISNCTFADEEAAKQYVENQIKDRDLLMHVLEDVPRTLTPVRKLEILPGETKLLYVLLTVDGQVRSTVQGRLQKQTAKVNIQLLDYDKERQELLEGGFLEPAINEDLLTRELPVNFVVCRALLSLAQKNISFGALLTNEHRAKTLVLTNISDVPLLYKLKKTGSIASGDLHIINGRTGILRPHSTCEVNFVFQPSLGGSFHETLVVSNVYDPSNDQVVTLKATISRADTFWLNTSSIDFGGVNVGEWSRPQSIVFVNNSKQSRTFMLKAGDSGSDERVVKPPFDVATDESPVLRFMVEEEKKLSSASAVGPEQELIEALERKGLAYERKGKADKAAKIRKQIEELKSRDSFTVTAEKEIDVEGSEGSKVDKAQSGSDTESQHNYSPGESNAPIADQGLGRRSSAKGSDGYVSLSIKGGESKVVLVSILSSLSAPSQRVVGTLLAYESKNQDVVKKIQYEATVVQGEDLRDISGSVNSSPFKLKLRTSGPEIPRYATLLAPSPSLSPESSAPTSPVGAYTPQSAAAQNLSRTSSPDLSTSISHFNDALISSNKDAGPSSNPRNLATSFAHALDGDGWGSKQHILQWGGEEAEGIASVDNVSDCIGVDEDDGSRSESYSGVSGFEPLFKIDLSQQTHDQATGIAEHRDGDDEMVMYLSSAADLAKSLVSQKIQELGKAIFAGELNLEDCSYQDKREASFTLRSLSSQDISIQFHLAWDGEPDVVELWVRNLDEAVESSGEGDYLAVPSSLSKGTRLSWDQTEASDCPKDDNIFYTSIYLKGGAVAVVTLVRPDESPQVDLLRIDSNGAATENGGVTDGYERKVQATGVLTMHARPDDGLSQQLLVRVKQLDRCLKVVPSSLVFPESDLSTPLTQDLTIKNRIGSIVTYTTTITGPREKLLADNNGALTDNLSASSNELAEFSPSLSCESVLSVSPGSGRIEAHGSMILKVTGRPLKPGKQMYTVHIQSSACLQETQISITMLPTRVHCLYLPDLPDGGALDMGFCFINAPSGVKVVPLRLQNLAGESLLLSFRSNLAKQVYISTSSEDLKRTDEFLLPGSASSTVFMCLKPGGDATAFEGGQCREIIGGMRITARSIPPDSTAGGCSSQEKSLDEVMVKFRAIVGRSLLQVSTSMIDLGRVREYGGFVTGEFMVSNPSNQMPLHFSLTSKKAILSVLDGQLAGKEAGRSVGQFGKSDMAVKFSLPVVDYGLIEDKVVVKNLSCPGQTAELVIRLFVDGGVVEAKAEQPLPHCEENREEDFSFPLAPGSPSTNSVSGLSKDRKSNPSGTLGRTLPFSLRGEDDNRSSRQIRKASSAGDFYFANLTSSFGRPDGFTDDKTEKCNDLRGDHVPFLEANSIMDMGTVFISPIDRGQEYDSSSDNLRSSFFSITDLRPYHTSLVITNHSQEVIELEPFSNLPVLVDSDQRSMVSRDSRDYGGQSTAPDSDKLNEGYEIHQDTSDEEFAREELIFPEKSELVTKFTSCGRSFLLQPGCSTKVLTACVGLPRMSSSELDHFRGGNTSTLEGLLLFIKRNPVVGEDTSNKLQNCYVYDEVDVSHQVVEVLNIVASMCISKGQLAKSYVELGKVGYANRWADVQFELTVENISDAVLVYQLVDVPSCFSILMNDSPTEYNVDELRSSVVPRGSSTLRITLRTSKLEHVKEAGPCSWRLCLLNCNNPQNLMELTVEAEMTVCNLRFGGLTESALLLPPLTLPALPSAPPCITQFMVENLSLESLGVALQLQQAEETESLVMLEIVSQENTTIGELTLGPGERAELRVCARPISDNIPSHFLARKASTIRFPNVGSNGGLSSKYWEIFSSDIPRNINRTNSSGQDLKVLDIEQSDAEVEVEGTLSILRGDSELASTVCLGQLYMFSSPHTPDCIPIHGALLPGSSFDISPRNLHLQARLGGAELPQKIPSSDDVENGSKIPPVLWEGRHEPTATSQVVIRNFRAFESLQFSVLIGDSEQEILREIVSDYLSVQPLEGSIPPHGNAEITIKSRPWSRDVYDTFMRSSAGEEILNPEPIALTLFVQDVEGQKSERSSERIVLRIRPPVDVKDLREEDIEAPTKTLSRNLSVDKKDVARASNGSPLVLGLRGCTPVGGSHLCYEFNLGQQNVSSGGRLNWDLTLVGDKSWPIHYRLCTISEGDTKWLTITRPKGLVEASQQTIVQLSFSTKSMGVYSTYLVVENLENPADLKTVHLSLEVVAPRNARPEAPSLTFFHVLVQGDRSEGMVIDMGEVYYNFWYRNRSFAIVNEAPVAMEFLLSSSMDQNESTELNFSLANTSLKRFSSITLGAKSSVRIWIHFCPGPAKEKPITEDTCDEMAANIFVNCRLVKDYQQCIPFRARCRYPQIGISTTDIVFSTRRQGQTSIWMQEDSSCATGDTMSENGPVNAPLIESVAVVGSTGSQCLIPVLDELAYQSVGGSADDAVPAEQSKDVLTPVGQVGKARREEDMELCPPQQLLVVRNLYAHQPLQYLVKNDSLFFIADFPEPQVIPCAKIIPELTEDLNGPCESLHSIVVRPNMENLRLHQKTILKQKYLEEHLTIYNRSNPREKYTVSLRITAGHLRNFFAAPGRKNSYPFNRLELLITSFLSTFYSLTNQMLAGIVPSNLRSITSGEVRTEKGRVNDEGSSSLMKQQLRNRQVGAISQALEECLESRMFSTHASTDYETLYFDFHYLTDELVFYCLKERWSRGGGTLELATVQLAKLLYCALYRCQIFQVCLDSCWNFSSFGSTSTVTPEDQADEDVGAMVSQMYLSPKFKNGVVEPDDGPPEIGNLAQGEVIPAPRQSLKFLEDWTGQLRHFLSFFPDSREDLIPLRELNQKNQDVIIACRCAFGRENHSLMYRS
ncbi:hypothetical protein MPTK1_1g02700 [Marchantia polymorpha subsp. ruderalis]|uniref:Uncharacterized protein n=2 Tax=Marchantia polymorpha TaxID=3197 RepID=A0AAF6AKT8_MARPO|nr:hypothetical protein MARPO_0113s0018 [Marchantia polymorpha]BBM97058.1 hypothetical protein Mp_1g02700 [Marchantia polymorpha subsp. ruderalis]|eukprot:PTQ31280.1 hypothetical protein MARPO_0113s0018 [Marchantia polymorpha]